MLNVSSPITMSNTLSGENVDRVKPPVSSETAGDVTIIDQYPASKQSCTL